MSEEKKELTAKQQQQRKKILVYPLMGFGFLLAMYFIFAPTGGKEKEAEKVNGFNVEVPQAENQEIISDKKTAYEREKLKQQQAEKMKSLQDFAFSLGKDSEGENIETDLDLKIEEKQKSPSGFPQNSIQASNTAYLNMTKQLQGFSEKEKTDTEKKQLEERVEELTKELSKKVNTTDQQIDLMEKSYKMAAKYLNTGKQPETENTTLTPSPKNQVKPENQFLTAVSNVREKIVTRLDQVVTDSVFMADYGKPRNLNFNTAENRRSENTRNTISACVHENQLLTFGNNEDQKVRFRLLEDVRAGALLIPRNNLFSGDVKLQGGRLQIVINSIEYAGNIIPVKLTVYDLEGQKGINAPNSQETNALKEAGGSMGENMGTAITFSQNAGQQVAADLAKTAIQTGSQYLSKKIKTVKVTLKADHQVLLLTSEK